MTAIHWLFLIGGTLGGALASLRRDYRSFKRERTMIPNVPFDWHEAALSAAEGAALGLTTAIGGVAALNQLT